MRKRTAKMRKRVKAAIEQPSKTLLKETSSGRSAKFIPKNDVVI